MVWWKVRLAPMALFAVKVLGIPYWSPEFWALPRAAYVAARIYHQDQIEAQWEQIEEAEAKAKSRHR